MLDIILVMKKKIEKEIVKLLEASVLEVDTIHEKLEILKKDTLSIISTKNK